MVHIKTLKFAFEINRPLICELFFRLRNAQLDKIMKQWDEMCIDYRNNEENIEVVDETQFKIELEPPKNLDSLATSSGS